MAGGEGGRQYIQPMIQSQAEEDDKSHSQGFRT